MNNFYTNVKQWGDNLLVRAIVDGQRRNFKVPYKPTLFSPSGKESKYKSLAGVNTTPIKFNSMKEAKSFLQLYKNQENMVFGMERFNYTYIGDTYPGEIEYDINKIKIVTIDIEVKCENGFPEPDIAAEEMLSITVKDHKTQRFTVWGIKPYNNTRDDVTYIYCETEAQLLRGFIEWWKDDYPDIITGWNSEMFDMVYICQRIPQVLNRNALKALSPWGIVSKREVRGSFGDQFKFDIAGITNLDYLHLYKKFTYTPRESYRLDYIAEVELGKKKDPNPYDTFKDWYTNDYQSFIDYNIQDVELVDQLEKKMRLIELAFTMAYDAKSNIEDVFTTVKYWEVLIYNYLKKSNIVMPQRNSQGKTEQYAGGYVKEPHLGESAWVMSLDLNSLYPHLIMQYNISPETITGKHINITVDDILHKRIDTSKLGNYALAASGHLFRKDKKGFLPELMSKIYNDRVVYKKKMIKAKQEYVKNKSKELEMDIAKYENFQMAKKIQLNACYGAVGNSHFKFFDLRNSESITLSGQMAIKWISNKLNDYLNNLLKTDNEDYVVAIDTDSCYLRLGDLVDKVFKDKTDKNKIVDFLDTIAKEKFEPNIEKWYQELADYTNAYEQKMVMAREAIADKGIWTAKKRYILNVFDNEGVRYKEPTLKIMGIEAIRSSTPSICRPALKKSLHIIMNGEADELNDFIQDFRDDFIQARPADIAFPRSANNLEKWSCDFAIVKKGTPIHVRGVLIHNHFIKKGKLTYKYPLIGNGEKVKYIYLRTPNITQSHVFSFMSEFPKELNLEKSIDRDLQFEKSFMDPLMVIVDHLKWNIDKSYGTQMTLEGFFT